MKIAVMSDQHGSLPRIPECDIVVLAGDITNGNPTGPRDDSDQKWWDWLHTEFQDWIEGRTTVMVAGNHDTCIEKFGRPNLIGVHYLQDECFVRDGISFWGTPWIRKYDTLAFNATEEELREKHEAIPIGVHVIVSHMPAFGCCDDLLGSRALSHHVFRASPQYLITGHIHHGCDISRLAGTTGVHSHGRFTTITI